MYYSCIYVSSHDNNRYYWYLDTAVLSITDITDIFILLILQISLILLVLLIFSFYWYPTDTDIPNLVDGAQCTICLLYTSDAADE